MEVVGIDGYSGGWIAVALTEGRFARAAAARTCAVLLEQFPDARAIAIDIPIHPPEGSEPRAADVAARALLGSRAGTSVFPTPPRSVLEAMSYPEASNLCRELTGRGLSRQSFALAPRILEVDELAHKDERIIEVHPEVSFHALADRPLGARKKSWAGQMLRARLLADAGIVIPADIGAAGIVPADDVLDAAIGAWSGHRYALGQAERLPEEPRGERAVIWF